MVSCEASTVIINDLADFTHVVVLDMIYLEINGINLFSNET